MRIRLWLLAGALGIVVGGLAAFWLGGHSAEVESAPTSSVLVPVASIPGIADLGSFEVRQTDLVLEDGRVAFSFDLISTAPASGFWSENPRFQFPPEVHLGDVPVAVPVGWTLLTERGEFKGEQPTSRARRALFSVPDDLVLDEVLAVRLDEISVAVPYLTGVGVPWPAGEVADVVPGVSLGTTVSDLGAEWRVAFSFNADPSFEASSLGAVAHPRAGGFGVRPDGGWEATFDRSVYPDLPNPMHVTVGGLRWVTLAEGVVIEVER